jgi:hypothetical protein
MMKSLVRGATSSAIAKNIFSIPKFRNELLRCFLTHIEKECTALCSTNKPSPFRAGELQEINFTEMEMYMENTSPTILSIIKTIISKPASVSAPVCAAILLKNRNKHMSRVPHVIAQVLDHAGATDEVVMIFFFFQS